jgi:pimeloyl-ACP methyl ester carboxylesterase
VLHVEELGEGTPLVVLPSFGVSHAVMQRVFEPALGELPVCRRLYPDLPGVGGSPAVEPTSDAVLAAILDALDHRVGAQPFLAAGWSYGGYLAAAIARRIPERLVGCFAVCAGPRIRPEDRDLSGVLASDEEEQWLAGVPESLRDYFRLAVGRQRRSVALRIATTLSSNGPRDERYLEQLRGAGFALVDEDTPFEYAGPVTLLSGRRDRIAGYVPAFGSLEHYPDAEFELLSGAGHYLPLEEPARFAASIRGWLRRCGLGEGEPEGPIRRGVRGPSRPGRIETVT